MRRRLTQEGERMFDNLQDYERKLAGEDIIPPVKPPIDILKLMQDQKELLFLRKQLKKMIQNSNMVTKDCRDQIDAYTKIEQYFASEAKVALTCHTNLIERLNRILDGKEAFDFKIPLPEEDF